MQVAEQRHFHERALFYATFPIQEQVLSRSRKRPALPHDLHFDYAPVYVISFLNFSFHPQDEQIVYRYDIRERYRDELMTDRLNFLFVEMPNAGDEEPREGDSFTKKLSWAFRHMTALTERPAGLVGEIFERIFEACEVAKLSDEEFNQYNEESMTKWDYDDIVNTAWLKGEAAGRANGLEEGRAAGRAEGRAEGLAEGREEGRAEGREEGREKALEAVRARLRALGVDPAVIEEVAGEEFNQYNEESMTKWDYDDIVNTAWLKGEAAGRANGLEEGRAEGREEGRAEGRERALEAVRARLRALGMDPEVIEEVAGGVESRQ